MLHHYDVTVGQEIVQEQYQEIVRARHVDRAIRLACQANPQQSIHTQLQDRLGQRLINTGCRLVAECAQPAM